MNTKENKIQEFILQIDNEKKLLPFPLQLSVSFIDQNDHWFIEAKKLKFDFKSSNKDINESQHEFAQLIVEYIEYLFNNNILIETLVALNFKLMPKEMAIIQFNKERIQSQELQPLNTKTKKINVFENLVTNWKIASWQPEIIV